MKEMIKRGSNGAAPYFNTLTFEGLFMAIDERFHLSLTRTELALMAPLAAVVFHLAIKYGRSIASALYNKLLRRVNA